MSLKARLTKIEKTTSKRTGPTALEAADRANAAAVQEWRERCAWFVHDHVDEDLQVPVLTMMLDPRHEDNLCSWLYHPFARWAPLADDYRFPRALLEFIANPPAMYFFGHNCGTCGLSVPICTFGDTKDASPFEVCPACGGETGFRYEQRPAQP